MFQSSDDINFDEDFLSDAFEVPSTNNESTKRNSDPLNDQPVKKICAQSPDNNTKNILSIIKSKSLSQTNTITTNPFLKPNNTIVPNNKSSIKNAVLNQSANQEKLRRVVQRKFPGPAGILPEQKQLSINTKTLEENDTSVNNKTLEPDEIVCSQLSEDIFRKGPWNKMITDWSAICNRISLPNKYTISWIKSKAVAKKLLGQKTPFLAAVIQTVDCSSKDPMILLKDKTGDIQATLLNEVWEEYCDYLSPGSVIVLKQVGVLSTLKKHYLALTLNNLVTIYSEQENEEVGNIVESINIQKITIEEFIKTIENAKQSHEAQKVLLKIQPATNNNPYFKKSNSFQQKSPEIPTYNPIIRNEIKHNSISAHNETNVNRTPNKFNFKVKDIVNQSSNETNKENKLVSVANTSFAPTDNNTIKVTEEENVILTQVLEGVDTDSLFEDF